MSVGAFVPLAPGRLRAWLAERRSRLLLERGTGGIVGAIDLKPPVRLTTVLQSVDGEWTVRHVEAVGRHRKAHLAVSDRAQAEVARVWFEGPRQQLELESGTLVFEHPRLLPFRRHYGIEGLLTARPGFLVAHVSPIPSGKVFAVDVTPELGVRRDASLVVLLAAWLTWSAVSPAPA